MITSKLSSKGQTTIPKEIRNALELDPGDRLAYEIREGEVVIHPLAGDIFDHKGTVEPSQRPEDFKAVRKQVKSSVADRVAEE